CFSVCLRLQRARPVDSILNLLLLDALTPPREAGAKDEVGAGQRKWRITSGLQRGSQWA
nr:hypothetical protein [Tanacetum cinerariifolium]